MLSLKKFILLISMKCVALLPFHALILKRLDEDCSNQALQNVD
jgi:hypothetical protein